MRRIMTTLALSAALVSTAAFADDSTYSKGSNDNSYNDTKDQAGTYGGDDTSSGVTTKSAEEIGGTYLKNEVVGIRPQLGALIFKNTSTGQADTRAAGGLTLDVNLMKGTPWYVGPSTGLIYSHMGPADGNFFGANSPSTGSSTGGNLFFVPANIKAGYNVTDRFRVAAHGGANLLYRSSQVALNTGNVVNGGSDTTFYPNAGLDIEWALGSNIALTFRPDYTFTPADDLGTATLAVAIPIG